VSYNLVATVLAAVCNCKNILGSRAYAVALHHHLCVSGGGGVLVGGGQHLARMGLDRAMDSSNTTLHINQDMVMG